MVPLSTLLHVTETTGPDKVMHYNVYPSADISGTLQTGFSTGQAIDTMEKLAAETLPQQFGYECTDLSLQQKLAGKTQNLPSLLTAPSSPTCGWWMRLARVRIWNPCAIAKGPDARTTGHFQHLVHHDASFFLSHWQALHDLGRSDTRGPDKSLCGQDYAVTEFHSLKLLPAFPDQSRPRRPGETAHA